MELRRQHRIVYQTKIRLRAPGRDDSVIARVQNLSARGVYITGSELPAAGTEVQCRLLLAGERRTLRGRVAWVRPASPTTPLRSPGAGIEFLDLGEADTDLLHKLVDPGDDERQPVDVWFEGMKAPIRCQAVVAGEGVVLATRLPFMRLNSPVRVTFSQHGPVMTHEGTLESVMLEPNNADGIPHLQVNVSMAAPEAAQGSIETDGTPQEHLQEHLEEHLPAPLQKQWLRQPAPVPVVSVSPIDRDRTQRFESPRPLVLRLQQVRAQGRLHLGRALHWLAQGMWRPAGAGFALGALAVGGFSFVLRPTVFSAAPVQAAAPAPRPAPIGQAPTPLAIVPAATARTVEPEAAAAPALARQQDDNGATLVTDDSGVRLTIPVSGTGLGAEQYRLVDPPGVAITLPRGRPLLPPGLYRPGNGPVRIQVRRKPGGTQIRFFYDPRLFRGRLAGEAAQLVLELQRR